MPDVLEIVDALKDFIKKIFGLPLYLQSEQQQQYMKQKEIIRILKKNIDITQSRGMLLIISYSGRSPTTSSRIVEILAHQCKELLLRNKNQEAREALRYIER